MKDLKQFIKTTIREFLNEDVQNRSITEIIKKELDKWENEYNIKTCDINTGDCFVFVEL